MQRSAQRKGRSREPHSQTAQRNRNQSKENIRRIAYEKLICIFECVSDRDRLTWSFIRKRVRYKLDVVWDLIQRLVHRCYVRENWSKVYLRPLYFPPLEAIMA